MVRNVTARATQCRFVKHFRAVPLAKPHRKDRLCQKIATHKQKCLPQPVLHERNDRRSLTRKAEQRSKQAQYLPYLMFLQFPLNLIKFKKEMKSETSASIIIDNGSGIVKGGLSGDEAPRSIFPNVVGKPKNQAIVVGADNKECYLGKEAQTKKGVLKLSYPIEHGVIKDWQDMEKVWHHCFYSELLVDTAEQPLLISETPNVPFECKRKMTEIFFETFNAPAAFFMFTNVLGLFAHGRTTGLVIDSGHDVTNVLPVFEGYSIQDGLETQNFGGKSLSKSLLNIYEDKIPQLRGNMEVAEYIKKRHAYVAYDLAYAEEQQKQQEQELFSMPDGQSFYIGDEIYTIPEAMFDKDKFPELRLEKTLPQMCIDAVNKCDLFLRSELFSNVIVTGGNTMIPGFCERLDKEMKGDGIHQVDYTVEIEAADDRNYSVWIGGSLMASLSSFQQMWISRSEYDEHGKDIVQRKCLI